MSSIREPPGLADTLHGPRSNVCRSKRSPVLRPTSAKGVADELRPGICIRLYSEDDYLRRDAYTTPEIRRTNLASVILQAKALHLGDVDRDSVSRSAATAKRCATVTKLFSKLALSMTAGNSRQSGANWLACRSTHGLGG